MERRTQLGLGLVLVAVVVVAGATTYALTRPAQSPFALPNGESFPICDAPPGGSVANWTSYHQGNGRGGFQPMPTIRSVQPSWSGPVRMDGQVYAEPLVCGHVVYVATEQDSVYALNASNGQLLWHTNLGTPVPGSSLPCGDIDPSGITGTPAIDPFTGILYVVAFVSPLQHVLFGLDLVHGSIASRVVVDPPGADASAQQQRGALAIANGLVYVPLGGLDGDCADYHGWVVGVRIGTSEPLLTYEVPTHREGGIWSPAGITVAPNGSLYVSTGNGDSNSSFDFGDSVIELTPSLREVDYFAPTNWAELNVDDTDLGSVAPTVLPNGDLFQIGKAGVGYLLNGSHLGGIGGQLAEGNVCAGAYGGTARVGASLLVSCVDGLYDLNVSASNFSVAWHSLRFDAGPAIVTGDVAWTIDLGSAHLDGLNRTTGHSLYSFPLGSVDHFSTPAAGPGMIYVGAGDELAAFTIA